MKKLTYFMPIMLFSFNTQAGIFGNSDAEECQNLLDSGKSANIARYYCERAANAGDAKTQAKLGEMALAEKNEAEAKKWFEKAASAHNPTALYFLGYFQENGIEQVADVQSALFYYKQACEKDELRACQRLEVLAQQDAKKQAEQLKLENDALLSQTKSSELQSQKKDSALERSQLELEKAKVELERLKAEAQKYKAEAEKAKAEVARIKRTTSSSQPAQTTNYPVVDSTAGAQSSNGIDLSQLKFRNGLAKFEQNGLWGYVDEQGNVAISPRFSYAAHFYYERAAVRDHQGKWGFIDTSGRFVVSPSFCSAGRFSDGLAGVNPDGWINGDKCIGGHWGFIDVNGNWVIPAVLDAADGFSRGKAKVIYKGHTGFINKQGNWVE